MICIRTFNGTLLLDVKAVRVDTKFVEGDLTYVKIPKYEISVEYGDGRVSVAGQYSNEIKAKEQLNKIYSAIKDGRKVVSLSRE